MTPDRYEVRRGKFGCYMHDTVTGQDLPLSEVERLLNGLTDLASELCWYGKKLAGGVSMVGPNRPAKKAADRWYETTMRKLNALSHSATEQAEWDAQKAGGGR